MSLMAGLRGSCGVRCAWHQSYSVQAGQQHLHRMDGVLIFPSGEEEVKAAASLLRRHPGPVGWQ